VIRIGLVLLVMFGAACTDRTAAPLVPFATQIGTPYRILTATTRVETQAGIFGRDRQAEVSFLDLTVTVPPEHRPGRMRVGHANPDPERHFVMAGQERLPGETAFRAALRDALTGLPPTERETTIFVHGYNNSFADGAFRMAQIMRDFELPGAAMHFSWPSATNPLGYVHDRDSVLMARDGFERTLREVAAAGPERTLLVGHSMGTLLIMETLRQIEIADPGWARRNLSGVILISPDIAVDLFKTQADRFAALPRPFAIFVSERDRALRLSARLTGVTNRLGSLNKAEEVANLPVTLVDISAFDGGPLNHFTAGTSPALIQLLSRARDLDAAFQQDRAGQSGLLPGTVLTVRNATQLILSPGLVLQN